MFGTVIFRKHIIKFGIGGDKVEDVVWRIGNLNANKEVRYVLICGTNNIDKNLPEDIVKGIKYGIQLSKSKFYHSKVGILPRNFSTGIRRDKIRSVNFQIKDVVAEMNSNVTYIHSEHSWKVSGGHVNTNIYY